MSVQAILRPGPRGGFWVEVPSLPGCVTFGATRELALENAYEVVERAVDGYRAMGQPVPWQPERPDVPAGAEAETLQAVWDLPDPPIDFKALEERVAQHKPEDYIDIEDILREYGVNVPRREE